MGKIQEVSVSWDDLYEQIHEAEGDADALISRLATVAAQEYTEQTKRFAESMNVKDTGELVRSIKPGKITKTGDGVVVEVYPQGTRRDKKHPKGERNETIGFVTEYGTAREAARPFMSASKAVAQNTAYQKMQEVLDNG